MGLFTSLSQLQKRRQRRVGGKCAYAGTGEGGNVGDALPNSITLRPHVI